MTAFLAGLISLLCSAALSAALVAEHVGSLTLPGCGPESACARITATPWGRLPVGDWPLSFLGLSYFLGLLVAWSRCRSGVPTLLLHTIRVGAAASILLVGVMLFEDLVCGYCLAVHLANLGLCAAAHRSPRRRSGAAVPLALVAGTVALTTIALASWRTEVDEQTRVERERALAESTAEILAGAESAETGSAGSARYRLGPEEARVRIVVFSDFECEDCKRVHADLERTLEDHDDVALSARHFPMCADCNPRFEEQNMHPNACWAARAAEAAGMLEGTRGFWEFGRWLFERDGRFTDAELEQHLADEGYDVPTFVATMEGEETLRRVRADIDEGLRRGLHFTPMVFVNGVELQGVLAPSAVPRAVAQVLASHPEAATSASDVPQTALEKYVADWRSQPVRSTAPERRTWAATQPGARIEIVIWADYQEQHAVTADRILRTWADARPDASYSFRHFPAHSGCNSGMKRIMHPAACTAARAAESASLLGDEAQYWQMHEWLFSNQKGLQLARLLQAATELGFDPGAFERTMASAAVAAAIEGDARQGFPMLFHGTIPAIYINGRVVPRWRLEGENVLETILDELY